jgi:hypothetical protein
MKDLESLNKSIVHLFLYSADPRCPGELFAATATGFIWKRKKSFYLVTNWHVIYGLNHDTGKRHANQQVTPNFLKMVFFDNNELVIFLEGQEKTKWIQGENVRAKEALNIPDEDLVMRPIDDLIAENNLEASCYAFNDLLEGASSWNDLCLEVTMPMSIIGYPSLDDSFEHPLCWVEGKVAAKLLDKPFFLVNAYPYGGMSGSPVLWVYPNRPMKMKVGTVTNGTAGVFVQFFGVYSGRVFEVLNKDLKNPAPLARVWRGELINEILATYESKMIKKNDGIID